MSVVSVSVVLSLVFSPLTVTVEVTPTFLLTNSSVFNMLGKGEHIDATSGPFLIITHLDYVPPGLLQEELIHTRQWQALGWAYPILYEITRGDIFEPYAPGYPVPFSTSNLRHKMWIPPDDMVDACPFLRVNVTTGEAWIAPCYLGSLGGVKWQYN